MGYCNVIAKRVGVTQKSVSHYFRGKSNSHRIEMALLELIVELNWKEKTALEIVAELALKKEVITDKTSEQ